VQPLGGVNWERGCEGRGVKSRSERTKDKQRKFAQEDKRDAAAHCASVITTNESDEETARLADLVRDTTVQGSPRPEVHPTASSVLRRIRTTASRCTAPAG